MFLYNMFSQLEYSDEQKAVISKYHQLSSKPILALDEIYEISCIWQHAEKDQKLFQALSFVDDVQARVLDEPLLSENQDFRTFLSEYVPAYAADKLSHENRERKELDTGELRIAHICPDGSAVTTINVGKYMRLEDLDEQICEVCKRKYSEHQRVTPGEPLIVSGSN